MSIIQQSFSHSVSSLMIAKIQGNIIDTLLAPLSATEVTLAIIMAAVTRGLVILVISVVVFSLIIEIHIYNIFYIFIGAFLGSIVSIFQMALQKKSRKSLIPFAPFLSVATLITLFYGNLLIKLYLEGLVR